jgi:hypothetical protein
MSEEYDSELQECREVLVELWTAVGKPLEADRRLLGEIPHGLLELVSSAARVAETAAPRGCSANGGLMPPRLVAAGNPGEWVSRGAAARYRMGGGLAGSGGCRGSRGNGSGGFLNLTKTSR